MTNELLVPLELGKKAFRATQGSLLSREPEPRVPPAGMLLLSSEVGGAKQTQHMTVITSSGTDAAHRMGGQDTRLAGVFKDILRSASPSGALAAKPASGALLSGLGLVSGQPL